jgi:hypothetical protein
MLFMVVLKCINIESEPIFKAETHMALLRATFEQQGYLYAICSTDPAYSILLTRNSPSEAPWRVTSFRDRDPVGHREYDHLKERGRRRTPLVNLGGRG